MTEEASPVKGYECIWVKHIPKTGYREDTHLIKLHEHHEDGTVKSILKEVKNFKRSFYTAKESTRIYKQKRERESLENLNPKSCIQSNLKFAVAEALGVRYGIRSYRQLAESPYLYGSDVSSCSLIKHLYSKKSEGLFSFNKVAFYDTETSMFDKDGSILMANVCNGETGEVFVSVRRDFFNGMSNIEEKLKESLTKHLSDEVDNHGLKVIFDIVDTEKEVIANPFKKLHEWQPDFVAIWNMLFDMERVFDRAKVLNLNLAQIFKDPSLGNALATARLAEGRSFRVSAAGKHVNLEPSQRWHHVYNSSSWQFVCAMSTYRIILRMFDAKLKNYKLDTILDIELGKRKLSFTEADGLEGGDWHEFMQSKHPVEYTIYNVFDTFGMKLMDDKTLDLKMSLTQDIQFSDLENAASSAKRTDDMMYFSHIEQDHISGTVGPRKDLDEPDVLSLRNWTITLPARNRAPVRTQLFKDYYTLDVGVYILNKDSDLVSSYPKDLSKLNVSKATTVTELCSSRITESDTFRKQCINLIFSESNSVEFCSTMMGYPTLKQLT